MKKRGGRFLMILGAGLAIMAFGVVYILTSNKGIGTGSSGAAVATPIPMVSIAVARADLAPYTMLDANNVALKDVEASIAMSSTVRDPNLLYGKMTMANLVEGQVITVDQLATSGFSTALEKGERAYTLPVNERSTFGGGLTENDYVDVLWTHTFEVNQLIPGPDGKAEARTEQLPTTKTILENVQVLRVMSLRPTPSAKDNTGSINGGSSNASESDNVSTKKTTNTTASAYAADAPPTAVLILAVTDQQAEVIKYARENGTIDLALRSSAPVKDPDGNPVKGPDGKDIVGDHDPEKTTGITTKVLVEQYGLLLPEILVK